MATNKKKMEEIDESLLLSSIKSKAVPKEQPVEPIQEKEPEIIEPEKTKENKEVKRKRNAQVDFTATFLLKKEIKNRHCVYISQEVYNILMEITRSIGNHITVGAYVDNVLLHHLEIYQDEINEQHIKDRKDKIVCI